MKEIEFVADFTGSDSIKIEVGNGAQQQGMIVKREIGSKKTEVIAEVRMLKNWKLKSKFRFTLKNPPIDKQREYMLEKIKAHSERVEIARKIYPLVTFSMMGIEQCFKKLKDINAPNYIDLEFSPVDKAIFD